MRFGSLEALRHCLMLICFVVSHGCMVQSLMAWLVASNVDLFCSFPWLYGAVSYGLAGGLNAEGLV